MSTATGRDLGTAAHAVLHQCLVGIYEWGLPARAADYLGAVIEVADEPHEPLSPSGAKQWMNCAASLSMQQEHPEPAAEKPIRQVSLDMEYITAVQMCVDYVAMRVKELSEQFSGAVVKVMSEAQVSPGDALPTPDRRFDGTLDIALTVHPGDPLVYGPVYTEIIDFKAGAAVQIEPEDPQLDQYLLGLIAHLRPFTDGGTARLTVVQPRNFRSKQKIRWRDLPSTSAWKARHIQKLIAAREAIDRTPDAFSPGPETCHGCSAKGVCPASLAHALGKAGVLPEGAALPTAATDMYSMLQEGATRDTRALSGAQMRGILDAREMLKGALQAAEAWALDQMMKGTAPQEVVARYKLVRGRGSRKWGQDEEETLRRLRRLKVRGPDDEKAHALGKKELTETRLKSAPRVEQILKSYSIPSKDARWAAFNALVDKPEGALTIAPRSDPRDEVKPLRVSAEEAFDPANDRGEAIRPRKQKTETKLKN